MAVILKKDSLCLSTKDFSFRKGVFYAEVSDFNDVSFILDQRIYDDAIDTGFCMRNDDTGNVVRYVQTNVNRDRENDVISWEYTILPEDAVLFPKAANTKVILFND